MVTTTELKPHIGKRTGIDFSKHEVLVTQNEFVNIWHLKKPNSICDSIKFINTNGILAVTGDYGNWIFCREFHPDAKTGVSEVYWCEKLNISSCQDETEFDAEKTTKQLQELLDGGLVEQGYTGVRLEKMTHYIQQCLERIEDEFDYKCYAYREGPSFLDTESVICCKKSKYWLLAVFDGFDEICSRMKETQNIPQ